MSENVKNVKKPFQNSFKMSNNVIFIDVQKCAYVIYEWPYSNEVSLTDFTCPTVDSTPTTTNANFKSLDDQTLILTNTWDGNSHIFRADYGKYQSSYVLNRSLMTFPLHQLKPNSKTQ